MRLCHTARVPVIAFGVGTSLEGHVAAIYGGVCIDLSQMNRVLEVNAEDLDCRVCRRAARAVNEWNSGLFSDRSRANDDRRNRSTRASGTSTVRYGTMRDNAGLTVAGRRPGHCTGGRAQVERGLRSTGLFVSAEARLAS